MVPYCALVVTVPSLRRILVTVIKNYAYVCWCVPTLGFLITYLFFHSISLIRMLIFGWLISTWLTKLLPLVYLVAIGSEVSKFGYRLKYCVGFVGSLPKGESRSLIPSFSLLSGMLTRWLQLQQPSCTMKTGAHPRAGETECLKTSSSFQFVLHLKIKLLSCLSSFYLGVLYQNTIHYFQSFHPFASLKLYSKHL